MITEKKTVQAGDFFSSKTAVLLRKEDGLFREKNFYNIHPGASGGKGIHGFLV
jgi:hypothetical protein